MKIAFLIFFFDSVRMVLLFFILLILNCPFLDFATTQLYLCNMKAEIYFIYIYLLFSYIASDKQWALIFLCFLCIMYLFLVFFYLQNVFFVFGFQQVKIWYSWLFVFFVCFNFAWCFLSLSITKLIIFLSIIFLNISSSYHLSSSWIPNVQVLDFWIMFYWLLGCFFLHSFILTSFQFRYFIYLQVL